MKKRTLLSGLVVGALLTGSFALAGPGGYGNCGKSVDCAMAPQENCQQRQGNENHRLEMLTTVLDLSDAQQQQLNELFTQQRLQNQQLREDLQVSRAALQEVKSAETFNETDFRAKAAKQAELRTEMQVRRAKMKQQVYAMLTAEQQQKADKLHELKRGKGKRDHAGKGRHF